MASIREPNVFIVDDVAFIYPEHGMAIADEIEKRRHPQTLLPRDALRRAHPQRGGLRPLGEDGAVLHVPRAWSRWTRSSSRHSASASTPNQNFEALEVARKLKIDVAINLITDPSWGGEHFERAGEWATEGPGGRPPDGRTPYPGTELFHTESRELTSVDYRLYDIQHAVLPTKLPLREFYQELVKTQEIINRKFMGWKTAAAVSKILAGQLAPRADQLPEDALQVLQGLQRRPLLRRPLQGREVRHAPPLRVRPKNEPQDLLVHVALPPSQKRIPVPL